MARILSGSPREGPTKLYREIPSARYARVELGNAAVEQGIWPLSTEIGPRSSEIALCRYEIAHRASKSAVEHENSPVEMEIEPSTAKIWQLSLERSRRASSPPSEIAKSKAG